MINYVEEMLIRKTLRNKYALEVIGLVIGLIIGGIQGFKITPDFIEFFAETLIGGIVGLVLFSVIHLFIYAHRSSSTTLQIEKEPRWPKILVWVFGGLFGLALGSVHFLGGDYRDYAARPYFDILNFFTDGILVPLSGASGEEVLGVLLIAPFVGLLVGLIISALLLLTKINRKVLATVLAILFLLIVSGGWILGVLAKNASESETQLIETKIASKGQNIMQLALDGRLLPNSCDDDIHAWLDANDRRFCRLIAGIKQGGGIDCTHAEVMSEETCKRLFSLQKEDKLLQWTTCNDNDCRILLGIWFQDKTYCNQIEKRLDEEVNVQRSAQRDKDTCLRYIFR
ncbi:MAG: hypothetical protein AABX33_05060 [Nanoarchaeota archaeon]